MERWQAGDEDDAELPLEHQKTKSKVIKLTRLLQGRDSLCRLLRARQLRLPSCIGGHCKHMLCNTAKRVNGALDSTLKYVQPFHDSPWWPKEQLHIQQTANRHRRANSKACVKTSTDSRQAL